MRFRILNTENSGKCDVEAIKAETISIRRNLGKIFTFKDAERFIDALRGHSSVSVYVGKEAGKDADGDEDWRAYYIEPSEQKSSGYGSYDRNLLPHGTLAILKMDTEYDLEWALKEKAQEAAQYTKLFQEIDQTCRKIRGIDRDHRYADSDQFKFMTPEELEKTLPELKEAYGKLVQRGAVDLDRVRLENEQP